VSTGCSSSPVDPYIFLAVPSMSSCIAVVLAVAAAVMVAARLSEAARYTGASGTSNADALRFPGRSGSRARNPFFQSDVLVVWEGRNRSTIGLTWGWRMTGTRPAGRPHSRRPGGHRGCRSRGTSRRRRRKGRS